MADSTREISGYELFLELPIPKEYRRLVSLCSSEKQKEMVDEAYKKLIRDGTINGYHGIMILDSVFIFGKDPTVDKIEIEYTLPSEKEELKSDLYLWRMNMTESYEIESLTLESDFIKVVINGKTYYKKIKGNKWRRSRFSGKSLRYHNENYADKHGFIILYEKAYVVRQNGDLFEILCKPPEDRTDREESLIVKYAKLLYQNPEPTKEECRNVKTSNVLGLDGENLLLRQLFP